MLLMTYKLKLIFKKIKNDLLQFTDKIIIYDKYYGHSMLGKYNIVIGVFTHRYTQYRMRFIQLPDAG